MPPLRAIVYPPSICNKSPMRVTTSELIVGRIVQTDCIILIGKVKVGADMRVGRRDMMGERDGMVGVRRVHMGAVRIVQRGR
jgi:hypothetical protein